MIFFFLPFFLEILSAAKIIFVARFVLGYNLFFEKKFLFFLYAVCCNFNKPWALPSSLLCFT